MAPPLKMRDAITSRIKIMAKLDIAEKRLPQDGRIKIRFQRQRSDEGHRFPRVVPADAVRREDRHALARQGQADARHDEARLRTGVVEEARHPDLKSRGAWCWSRGPTGSGKTNTLYSSISKVNTSETNIMTAEDPVEFNLLGVNQVQVRESIGLNFAAALQKLPASGPQHYSGRRDPRLRNRRNRGEGGAHRPPGVIDAPHQRRAKHDQSFDEHGHRALPGRQLAEPGMRAAPRAPCLRPTARLTMTCRRRRWSKSDSRREDSRKR